jgi:hypothetical protein
VYKLKLDLSRLCAAAEHIKLHYHCHSYIREIPTHSLREWSVKEIQGTRTHTHTLEKWRWYKPWVHINKVSWADSRIQVCFSVLTNEPWKWWWHHSQKWFTSLMTHKAFYCWTNTDEKNLSYICKEKFHFYQALVVQRKDLSSLLRMNCKGLNTKSS